MLPKPGYNELLFILKTKDTVKSVQVLHPNTEVLYDAEATTDASLNLVAGETGWFKLLTSVREGEYTNLEGYLKGAVPPIKAVYTLKVSVKNTPVAVTLNSISLNGPNSVNESSSGTYMVAGSYSDGSSSAITSGITWGANTPNGVLTVAANNVTGDSTTTTVTATVGGKSASKTVNVVDTTVPAGSGDVTYTPYDVKSSTVLEYEAQPVY